MSNTIYQYQLRIIKRIIFLLLYLYSLIFPAHAVIPAGPEKFDCGEYVLRGILQFSTLTETYLTLYPETTRSYRIQVIFSKNLSASAYNGMGVEIKGVIDSLAQGNKAKLKDAIILTAKSPLSVLEKVIEKKSSHACK